MRAIPMKKRSFSLSSLGLGVLATMSLLAGCVGKVDVGDATDGSGGSSGADTASGGSSGGPADQASGGGPIDCTEEHAQLRTGYDAWHAEPNDFGALAGSVFAGYLEGGEDLTLTIGSDHTASVLVGVAAPPPVADGGYLCTDSLCLANTDGLLAGATYSVHGASFQDDRLLVPVQWYSPYDPWCALQEPAAVDGCYYNVAENGTSTWRDTCALNDEVVDCQWLALALQVRPCTCTSVECFASIGGSEGTNVFDLRFEAAEDKLEGSLDGTNVHLFRVPD